jgi:hypothetical protein
MSSKFFTNNNDRNLFDKFKGIIEHMKDLYAFHAVVQNPISLTPSYLN